jgi:hypothetical protein
MSATDKNKPALPLTQESTFPPNDDTHIFRSALDELFPGREIDSLSTEQLREILALAQLRKAALNSTGGAS